MTTSTDIANQALAAIAAKSTIANLALETSPEARQTRILYGPTRDALLRGAPWNFARRTNYLTLLRSAPGTPENPAGNGPWDPVTMPAPPWLYEYAYPTGCLMVRYVIPRPEMNNDTTPPMFSSQAMMPLPVPQRRAVPFIVATSTDASDQLINVVLTNVRYAIGTYTLRIDNENLWDASFQEAMVAALASRLALALTGNVDVARTQAQQAAGVLRNAQARDGNEGLTQIDHIPDWLVARGYSPGIQVDNCVTPWAFPSFLVF